MAKNGTKNGQKQVETEQSSYYREYPVAFDQKREIAGVGQSDTVNNTRCRYCFQVHPFLAKKAPGTPVFGHCPKPLISLYVSMVLLSAVGLYS